MDNAHQLWRTDPATLRDYIVDAAAAQARIAVCPVPEKPRLMSLLGRAEQALEEGLALVEDSADPLELLLVLAGILQRQYRLREAARLQEQALRLAGSPDSEAKVRHHIGLRLFDEALYRDATAEFQWASDLYRVSGNPDDATTSHRRHAPRSAARRRPHGLLPTPRRPGRILDSNLGRRAEPVPGGVIRTLPYLIVYRSPGIRCPGRGFARR